MRLSTWTESTRTLREENNASGATRQRRKTTAASGWRREERKRLGVDAGSLQKPQLMRDQLGLTCLFLLYLGLKEQGNCVASCRFNAVAESWWKATLFCWKEEEVGKKKKVGNKQ
jgi:hypothetical protein